MKSKRKYKKKTESIVGIQVQRYDIDLVLYYYISHFTT